MPKVLWDTPMHDSRVHATSSPLRSSIWGGTHSCSSILRMRDALSVMWREKAYQPETQSVRLCGVSRCIEHHDLGARRFVDTRETPYYFKGLAKKQAFDNSGVMWCGLWASWGVYNSPFFLSPEVRGNPGNSWRSAAFRYTTSDQRVGGSNPSGRIWSDLVGWPSG